MPVRRELRQTKKRRKHINGNITRDAPKTPGLYAFLDKKGKPLYIGRTRTSIRDRLTQHVDPSHSRGKITKKFIFLIDSYDYSVCYDNNTNREIELRLIHKHKPQFNKLSNSNKP